VAQIIVEATHQAYDFPGTFADTLAQHAARFGLRRGDGVALLRWMYDLVGDPATDRWMMEVRTHRASTLLDGKPPSSSGMIR